MKPRRGEMIIEKIINKQNPVGLPAAGRGEIFVE